MKREYIVIILLFLSLNILFIEKTNNKKGISDSLVSLNDMNSNFSIKSNEFDNDSLQYIIITPENLVEVLNPLITWKNNKGTITEFITIEFINSNYFGNDIQEKIKNYLSDLKSSNSLLQWVLFVGNETLNPARSAYVVDGYASDGDLVPTDHYFSDLHNDWYSGNGLYADENFDEWYFDLTIGRIPFSSEGDITNYVQRIISYESNPISKEEYYNNGIFAAPIMNYPQPSYPLVDNAQMMEYTKENLFPENYNVSTLYEKAGIMPSDYDATILLNRTNMINILNEENQSSLLFLSGHGTKDSLWRQEWFNDINGDDYVSEDELRYYPYISTITPINTTINNQTPFFAYLDACDVGWFDDVDETLAEYLLKSDGLGIVAASRTTWYSTLWNGGNDYNQGLATRYWEHFWHSEGNRPAEILNKAKEDYLDTHLAIDERERKNILSYNYLGDPELTLYTEKPKEIEINKSYNGNSQLLEINLFDKNNNSKSIENAQVTVSVSLNDDYNTTYNFIESTDSNGILEVNINFTIVDKISLSFQKKNYIPELILINDISPPEAIITEIEPAIISITPEITIHWLYTNISDNDTIFCDLYVDEFNSWLFLGENLLNYSLTLSSGNHSLVLKSYDEQNNYFIKEFYVIVDLDNPNIDLELIGDDNIFIEGESVEISTYLSDYSSWVERVFVSFTRNIGSIDEREYIDENGYYIGNKTHRFSVYSNSIPIGDHMYNITITDAVNNTCTELVYLTIIKKNTSSSSSSDSDDNYTSTDYNKITSLPSNVIFFSMIITSIIKVKMNRKKKKF